MESVKFDVNLKVSTVSQLEELRIQQLIMKKRIVKYKRILTLGTEPPVVNELPEATGRGLEDGGG
jgi:hypothetical protein